MTLSNIHQIEIITKYKMNYTYDKIAESMNINRTTVCEYIKRYKNQELFKEEKRKRKRKHKLTEEHENYIVELMTEKKFWKLPKLKTILEEKSLKAREKIKEIN